MFGGGQYTVVRVRRRRRVGRTRTVRSTETRSPCTRVDALHGRLRCFCMTIDRGKRFSSSRPSTRHGVWLNSVRTWRTELVVIRLVFSSFRCRRFDNKRTCGINGYETKQSYTLTMAFTSRMEVAEKKTIQNPIQYRINRENVCFNL